MKKFASFVLGCVLAMTVGATCAKADQALTPGAYTVDVTTHYEHPETGVIEDSAGEDNKTLGQSMTEGAIYNKGLYEVTADHNYATIRIVLMDAVTEVNYYVADNPVAAEKTQEGIDSEGRSYADFRFEDSDISNIIKCKLFVEPMGRDVVFFITLANPAAGNGEFVVSENTVTDEFSKPRAEALASLESMEDIADKDRQEAKEAIKNAATEGEIQSGLAAAEAKNQEAKVENELGMAKSEALNKVDEMENISQDKKADMKKQIKDALSKEEIDAVLNGGDSNDSTHMIIIGGAVAAVVVAGIIVVNKSKKEKK